MFIRIERLKLSLLWISAGVQMPLSLLSRLHSGFLFDVDLTEWDNQTLIDCLFEMAHERLISFSHRQKNVEQSRSDLLKALQPVTIRKRASSVYFGLTAKGGKLWEEIYKPKWELCIVYCFNVKSRGNGPGRWYLQAADRLIVESLLKSEFLKSPSRQPIKYLNCWRPVYWKTYGEGAVISRICENELIDNFERFIPQWHLERVLKLTT